MLSEHRMESLWILQSRVATSIPTQGTFVSKLHQFRLTKFAYAFRGMTPNISRNERKWKWRKSKNVK